MGNTKKKIHGLILTGSALAGMASTVTSTTSASFGDFLKAFKTSATSAGKKIKSAITKAYAMLSLVSFVKFLNKSSDKKVDNIDIKNEINKILNIKDLGDFEKEKLGTIQETFKNWKKILKSIKENSKGNTLNLEVNKYKGEYADINGGLLAFLNLISRIQDENLEGFWYCSNAKDIEEKETVDKVTLKFININDYINKQKSNLELNNVDSLVESNVENTRLETYGNLYLKTNFFYQFLNPSAFLCTILDYRDVDNKLEKIRNFTKELLSENNNILNEKNKEYLKNMQSALGLYKGELDYYVKNVIKKDSPQSRKSAIDSVDFYLHVLNNCKTKLEKNKYKTLGEKNKYVFLAKLVANGAIQCKANDILNGEEKEKKDCIKLCEEILEKKLSIENLNK